MHHVPGLTANLEIRSKKEKDSNSHGDMQQPPVLPCDGSISELLGLSSYAAGLNDKITVVAFHRSVIIFFFYLFHFQTT